MRLIEMTKNGPELAAGAVLLYQRVAGLEEAEPIWVEAAETAGWRHDDVDRVAAQLADRWRTQRLELAGGGVLVAGRYRLLDEVAAVRERLEAAEVLESERDELLAALAVAVAVLQEVPEEWLVSAGTVAEREGVSPRRIRTLCLEGRIPGAHKRGKEWWVPSDYEISPAPRRPRPRRRPPVRG